MEKNLKNKIEASDTSISSLLKDQKFYIDYFQREYRWEEKHIKLLIEDLSSTFLKSYKKTDKRSGVANYQSYYLGPVVFSINTEDGKKSIVDGQQRITSITLFLIYLYNLQKDSPNKVSISEMIFSEKYGEKSFNMTDETREPCLKALFETGSYQIKDEDDETIRNMVERYEDISNTFPEEIDKNALPYFIDWLTENVVIVKITAYSDENAYTIFETMNDRGLNLTPTEMLKGYVLSKITNIKQRTEINELWKEKIKTLHQYGENADQGFFQSWFRGKYAKSIRPGKAGSENQDFEDISLRFHNWFKDNHISLFGLKTSDDFYTFFKEKFPFFVKVYTSLWDWQTVFNSEIPHVFYINHWGIAGSLQDPLLLSSINYGDKDKIVKQKLDFVARFIETFTVRRAMNYKKFGQTSIKYTMFNIVKRIRNNQLKNLGEVLIEETKGIEQKWDATTAFSMHSQNKKFVKHLLSRISSHLDEVIGKDGNYASYKNPKGRQFEIEHIWANKFDEHRDEFEQENEFKWWRNSIGALILLPNGINQSFSSDIYEDKLEHYIKENTYAQTLHKGYYQKNPNFLKSAKANELKFKSHDNFKKEDIEERAKLVKRICKQIWSTEYYKIKE
jgi:uncharacterized protein with ParB-like and HNH nuclease domain